MDDINSVMSYVWRPGTLTIAVAVVILTFFTRKIVESIRPNLKKRANEMQAAPMYASATGMWWNEVILYAIPVLYGAAFAFVKSSFLHHDVMDFGGKLAFCGGIGWFSSLLYKGVRKVILQKTGVDIQIDASLMPPPVQSAQAAETTAKETPLPPPPNPPQIP